MVSDTIINELVNVLSEKTKANQIQWSLAEDRKFSITLPVCRLSVGATDPEASMPDILFEVDTPEGAAIGAFQIKAGDPKYQEMQQLLNSAQSSLTDRLDRILKQAAKSVQETSGPVGGLATPQAPPTPPPMPPRPTDEQARQFFEKIAGEWLLDFSRGTETLRIDADGNYFIYPPGRANEGGVTPLLKFRFALNACDRQLEHVEVSKQELNGKVRQVEVLTIRADSMHGYAKHDEHKLSYKRRIA